MTSRNLQPAGRRSALENATFRRLLLLLAGIPLGAGYIWQTLVQPLLDGFRPTDFLVYVTAARNLASGHDPYLSHFTSTIADPSVNGGYVYPPLLAWSLIPARDLPDATLAVAALVILHLCVLAFLLVTGFTIRLRGFERWTLATLLAIDFFPLRLNLYGAQVNLLLLLASAIWLLAWVRGDRWWGGLAAGVAIAVKVLQAPLLALMIWGRRWRSLAAASAAFGLLSALAAPGYLIEFWQRVFPTMTATGFRENVSITAALIRLLQPSSFYGQVTSPPAAARVLGLAAGGAVLVVTWRHLSRPRVGEARRLLEGALALSALPLLAPLAWSNHLVFLLAPILILVDLALQRRDRRLLVAVVASWLLMGAGGALLLSAILVGIRSELVLRPLAETGMVGCLLLWGAAIRGLRKYAH